ncbi:MAG: LamB/YcsF family protein [Deltaproteobacteria bacterium]|nr:LamB/YcsF family protein [Deltaproteobacteria bacterium]
MTLNVDLGELPGEPEELYRLATQVNVACGGHAGDVASMDRAVALAVAAGTAIAAHPSYPDREGFGRRSVDRAPSEVARSVAEQCSALRSIAAMRGAVVRAVKPHGALYHDLSRRPELVEPLLDAVVTTLGADAAIVGPPGSPMAARAATRGLRWIAEGFADRGYAPDGSLLPRGTPGALIEDPSTAARQAVSLALAGKSGRRIDTLCVHGDTPNAVAIARAVREALASSGVLA